MNRVEAIGDEVSLTIGDITITMSPTTALWMGARLQTVGGAIQDSRRENSDRSKRERLWARLLEEHPDGLEVLDRHEYTRAYQGRHWVWWEAGVLRSMSERGARNVIRWEHLPPEVGPRRVRVQGGRSAHLWEPGSGIVCGVAWHHGIAEVAREGLPLCRECARVLRRREER